MRVLGGSLSLARWAEKEVIPVQVSSSRNNQKEGLPTLNIKRKASEDG
jgi:hypothetical protein